MQGRNRGAPGTGFPNVILRRTDEVIETIRAIQPPLESKTWISRCERLLFHFQRSRPATAFHFLPEAAQGRDYASVVLQSGRRGSKPWVPATGRVRNFASPNSCSSR